jgi:phosphatidylglycerophosphatase B
VLVPTFALALLSFALPDIALDGAFANLVLRVADSATWEQLPLLCIAALLLLASRPGPGTRQRAIEAAVIVIVMLVALGGNAMLNENVIKPALAEPRPNIEALAQAGALGEGVEDGDDFYALGNKNTRRELLSEHLAELEQPPLTPRVRAHWIHEAGYSFPSGHATAAMTFASLMVALGFYWLAGWRLLITSVAVPVWAACVVYSRPLLGVHTPVDVTVGTLLGFGWGLGAFVFIRWVVREFEDEAPAPPRGDAGARGGSARLT